MISENEIPKTRGCQGLGIPRVAHIRSDCWYVFAAFENSASDDGEVIFLFGISILGGSLWMGKCLVVACTGCPDLDEPAGSVNGKDARLADVPLLDL
jgi:hypothetical protein